MREDYLVILGASIAGAFWCLAGADTRTNKEAGKLLLRVVCMVFGLGVIGGHLMNKHIGLLYPWDISTVCFIIGATGNYHQTIVDSVIETFINFIKVGKFSKRGKNDN